MSTDLIDTHTHLDGFAQRGEIAAVLEECARASVGRMISIGTGDDDWEIIRVLAQDHPGRIAHTAGLHPCSVDSRWEAQISGLEAFWGKSPRPVALGECGLDRFHLPKEAAAAEALFRLQQAAFAEQLAIARRLGCPVVVHSRGAFRECIAAIDASGVDWARVVFHCFTEGAEEMAQILERGGRGSFTGILTYKNADPVRSAALRQGLERLMIETDAPYLAPVPRRGEPNRPAYLRHTADYAAKLFGIAPDELARVTSANAKAFFGV